jgi:hypothetical protein
MSRHEKRIVDSAFRSYNKHGCARCGQRHAICTAYVLRHSQKVVCQFCLRGGEAYIGAGTFCSEQSDGQAADRQWFAKHSDKEWRLRDAFPGEVEELSARIYLMQVSLGADGRILDEAAGTGRTVLFGPGRPGAKIFTIQMQPGQRCRIPCRPPAAAELMPDWVEGYMLPLARELAARSKPVVESLSPETLETVNNAVALLASPISSKEVMKRAVEQGGAMREARKAVRQ